MTAQHPLRRERELRGWSQAKVAEAIGTTSVSVSQWERRQRVPSPYFRERLCNLFSKRADELGLIAVTTSEDILSTGRSKKSLVSELGIHDPLLPVPPKSLIGREKLLAQLIERLCTFERPLSLALYGLPGVGKTTLVTTLATTSAVQARYPDGVLWAGLGTKKSDNLSQVVRWARVLGITLHQKEQNLQQWLIALRMHLAKKQMLFVLDDVWELEEAWNMHVGGPHCSYILTTRFPMVAHGWAVNESFQVSELDESESVKLLENIAPTLARAEPQVMHELARAVGGLPLALTIVGKYLNVQGASNQPRRLHDTLEQLRKTEYLMHLSVPAMSLGYLPSQMMGQSLSLYSVIATTEQQLDRQTQEGLCTLSLFPAKPNSFSEEAALAVMEMPVQILDTLYDMGLIESSSLGRYSLHQVIIDYMRSYRNTASHVLQRFVHYYVQLVENNSHNDVLLEKESRNILAALTFAFEQKMQQELIKGVSIFADFLRVRGLGKLAEVHLQRAYEAARYIEDWTNVAFLARHLGIIVEQRGDYEQAKTYFQEGLALLRGGEHTELVVRLLSSLGIIKYRQGDYERR